MAKVLGLDQSTNKTGWSWFVDNAYIESGVIDKSHIKKDIDKRTGEMGTEICNMIAEYQPDLVVIENVQAQSGVATVIALARLQGFILGWCYVHKIRTEIIAPSTWRSLLHFKQGAGVKRKELKQQSIDYIKNKYGMDLSEDEAESCCLNYAAHLKYNM